MQQKYEQYTKEDHEVWTKLFTRQNENRHLACHEYIDGLVAIGFDNGVIPNFKEMNRSLFSLTGWEVEIVPGWIPEAVFFEMLFNRRFPSSTWLRKSNQIDYLEEPDMFHDVFGHVPLLTHQPFVDFLFEISKIGLKYAGNLQALELLSRVYWYTVEFGLIQRGGETRIYGAGILSSPGETVFAMSNSDFHTPFSVSEILHTPFEKDIFQQQYFVINSFKELYESVAEIDREMENMLSAVNLYEEILR